MSYRVTAPLVLAKNHEGKVAEVYQGGIIQWLSDEQANHLLEMGMVEDLGGNEEPDGDEVPDESWKRDEIDAWAAELDPPLDTTGAANKADALALITEQLDAED